MEFLTKADLDGSKEQPKQLYSTQWLDVIEVNGWTVVDEKEAVVCIPYFKETGKVILRYEEIPTFKIKNPSIEKYVTVMSETMEQGEEPIDTLRRGLKEELGIVLNQTVKPEILTPIFCNKGTTKRYHICILPLMSYEFEQQEPTTDGSAQEKSAKNVALQLNEIDAVIIYDLITRYCIDLFKKHYSLF